VNYRPLTWEAVTYAARRIDDLHLVHAHEDQFQRAEAMGVVLDSLGDRSLLIDLTNWLDERGGSADDHQPFMLGVLFGLLIARYHDE
jgi:hypothetical protein